MGSVTFNRIPISLPYFCNLVDLVSFHDDQKRPWTCTNTLGNFLINQGFLNAITSKKVLFDLSRIQTITNPSLFSLQSMHSKHGSSLVINSNNLVLGLMDVWDFITENLLYL